MKIAILSDIHEGINRKNTETDILSIIEKWLLQHTPEVFIISGDMTAKPNKALALLNKLQDACPHTQILYVHGNHDVYHENSNEAYDILLQFPGNLGNGPVAISDNWVIIGDGGWYDYTYKLAEYTDEEFVIGKYGDFTWPDKQYANWEDTDIAITNKSVNRLDTWLQTNQIENVIMVTHVVPFAHFLDHKNIPSWDFFHAMMGSKKFGALALKHNVKKYVFGHIHNRYHEHYEGIEMICNPLGYYPHEWDNDKAETEILSTIKMIEI